MEILKQYPLTQNPWSIISRYTDKVIELISCKIYPYHINNALIINRMLSAKIKGFNFFVDYKRTMRPGLVIFIELNETIACTKVLTEKFSLLIFEGLKDVNNAFKESFVGYSHEELIKVTIFECGNKVFNYKML